MITSATRNSINHTPYQLALLFIPLALAWLALSPQARATCQQGCLTGNNTALGDDALGSNTTGTWNTATGSGVLISNTTGFANTANGTFAMFYNTIGHYNTATGFQALSLNTTGINNVTTGSFDTANGVVALFFNTIGNGNTANGADALFNLTTGADNRAMGCDALYSNTTGSDDAPGELDLEGHRRPQHRTPFSHGDVATKRHGPCCRGSGYHRLFFRECRTV